MKVLKKVETSNWSHKCHCYRCDSDLEAEQNDIRHKVEKKTGSDPRDGDSYSYTADTYYVACPVCHNQITIDEAKIPYVLKQKAKENGKSSSYYKD